MGRRHEEGLGHADWMIALVSAQSATSAMVVTEIETAHRLNVERGRPILIPIRLGDIGALHLSLERLHESLSARRVAHSR